VASGKVHRVGARVTSSSISSTSTYYVIPILDVECTQRDIEYTLRDIEYQPPDDIEYTIQVISSTPSIHHPITLHDRARTITLRLLFMMLMANKQKSHF
jgi:hypothetical protein